MLVLTVASHTLEGLPGPTQSPILIVITGKLDKSTQCLYVCTGEVTYELGTLTNRFGIRGQRWSDRLFDVECRFVFHIISRGDIRIFRLGFNVFGRETQWRALALFL
jgi:hypothetical protein